MLEAVVRREKDDENKLGYLRHGIAGRLRRITQENVKKVLKFRGQSGVKQLSEQAQQYIVRSEFPLITISSSTLLLSGPTRRRTTCPCGAP